MDKEKKDLLELYCEEWRATNQYVNDLDKNLGSFITICIAILCGAGTLLLSSKDNNLTHYIYYLLPICVLILFGYLCYQFRITAILRGHLSFLESKMNELSGETIFMWNSILVDTHMAHNNRANQITMIPIALFILYIIIPCLQKIITLYGLTWQNLFYCIAVCVCIVIGIIAFFRNEVVRKETSNTSKILELHKKFYKN